MGTDAARCDRCGRLLDSDPYNAWHRKYCKNPECVRERKRKRQRKWYAKRRASDPKFQAKENARCAEANRQRRAAAKKKEASAAPVTDPDLPALVRGMLSQLTDTVDPVELGAAARRFADRGRQLALSSPAVAGGPR